FQAEDGIRDRNVTGVQTCALPIYTLISVSLDSTIKGRSPSSATSKKASPSKITLRSTTEKSEGKCNLDMELIHTFVPSANNILRYLALGTSKVFIVLANCSLLVRSEEHTSELQSRLDLVCRLLLENKNI